jgi:MFS family permease
MVGMPGVVEERSSTNHVVPLHRNRDFRRLWLGQACSELGSNAGQLALPLLVLALTGSPIYAGLVGTTNLAAQAILTLPAGALVDRWNRRVVMMACEATRLVAAGLLVAALLTGWASLPLILVLTALEGAASVFFGPAQSAALRHIVPAVQLPVASARNEARSYAASLLGPPLGGALFALARFAPFLTQAVSFVASLVAVALIRRPLQDTREQPVATLGRSVVSGLVFVVKEPFLRALLCIAPPSNAAFTGLIFVLVVVLRERGISPTSIGVVQSLVLVGGLAGALLAPWLQPRVRPQRLIVIALWIATGLVTAAALTPGNYLTAALFAVAVLPAPAINAGLFAYQIAITPDAMQGRVDGTISLFAMGLAPLAPLLGGLLVERAGGQWAFLAFACVLAVAALIASLSRGIRRMRPLDHVDDTVAASAS